MGVSVLIERIPPRFDHRLFRQRAVWKFRNELFVFFLCVDEIMLILVQLCHGKERLSPERIGRRICRGNGIQMLQRRGVLAGVDFKLAEFDESLIGRWG